MLVDRLVTTQLIRPRLVWPQSLPFERLEFTKKFVALLAQGFDSDRVVPRLRRLTDQTLDGRTKRHFGLLIELPHRSIKQTHDPDTYFTGVGFASVSAATRPSVHRLLHLLRQPVRPVGALLPRA